MWYCVNSNTINKKTSKLIYNIVKKTYNKENKEMYFNYSKMLSKYDLFYYYYSKLDTFKNKKNKIRSVMILKKFPLAYKIVMIGSDDTSYGKQLLFNKIANLISSPGYMMEMSEKPFWIMRSRYNLFPIRDINIIKNMLNVKKTKYDIVLNEDYNYKDKDTYVYNKKVLIKNKIFQNNLALYGIPCPPIKSFTPMKWDDKNKKCIRIKNKTKKIINKSREKSKNKTIKKKI